MQVCSPGLQTNNMKWIRMNGYTLAGSDRRQLTAQSTLLHYLPPSLFLSLSLYLSLSLPIAFTWSQPLFFLSLNLSPLSLSLYLTLSLFVTSPIRLKLQSSVFHFGTKRLAPENIYLASLCSFTFQKTHNDLHGGRIRCIISQHMERL